METIKILFFDFSKESRKLPLTPPPPILILKQSLWHLNIFSVDSVKCVMPDSLPFQAY